MEPSALWTHNLRLVLHPNSTTNLKQLEPWFIKLYHTLPVFQLVMSCAQVGCCVQCSDVNRGTQVALLWYPMEAKECSIDLLVMHLLSPALNMNVILISAICLLQRTILTRCLLRKNVLLFLYLMSYHEENLWARISEETLSLPQDCQRLWRPVQDMKVFSPQLV